MPQTGSTTPSAVAGAIDSPRDLGADGRSGVGFMSPSVAPAGEAPSDPSSPQGQYSNGEQRPYFRTTGPNPSPRPPPRSGEGRGEGLGRIVLDGERGRSG